MTPKGVGKTEAMIHDIAIEFAGDTLNGTVPAGRVACQISMADKSIEVLAGTTRIEAGSVRGQAVCLKTLKVRIEELAASLGLTADTHLIDSAVSLAEKDMQEAFVAAEAWM